MLGIRAFAFLSLMVVGLHAAAQSREFKSFYQEGLDLFKSGDYRQALDRFSEAYRLESKPQSIKTEGTFFIPYQPAFQIALCHEKLGQLVDAKSWLEKAESAHEGDASKRKGDRADYHNTVSRIVKAADEFLAKQERTYRLKLDEAESLLAQNKFDQAEATYKKLALEDDSRPEAKAGLINVRNARETYVKSQGIEVRGALLDKDFDKARGILSRIAAVDANHPTLSELRDRIDRAEKDERQAQADAKKPATNETTVVKTPPKEEPKQTVAKADTPPRMGPDPAVIKRQQEEQEREKRRLVRIALLDALKPFQGRGDAEAALQKLAAIKIDGIESVGSYHWLKSMFLMARYHQSAKKDVSLLAQGKSAMKKAHQLKPDFKPDPDLYPAYVIDAYSEISSSN